MRLTTFAPLIGLVLAGAACGSSSISGGDGGGSDEDGGGQPLDAGTADAPDLVDLTTIDVCFDPLAANAPDLVAPGRGAEQWHNGYLVNVPIEGQNTRPLDAYYRFNWTQLEDGRDQYDWSFFDDRINDAIENGQKFSFGIMASCPGCSVAANGMINLDGGLSAYPAYLHDLMQGETPTDWQAVENKWTPNWNSPSYLSRYEALLDALAAHIDTASHEGVAYKDAIGYVDVRGYGSWGEWHVAYIADTVDDQAPGAATDETLIRIIDAHVSAFPNFPLVNMICAFDGGRYLNMGVSPEVALHALTVENDFGPLGFRRDNWGAMDDYLHGLLENNPVVVDGVALVDLIMDRWMTSPVVGEPNNGGTEYMGDCDYHDLVRQVTVLHATSFGNGNFARTNLACMRDNIRAASRTVGYRLVLEGGSVTTTLAAGEAFAVTLDWHNVGLTPTYERWQVVFELRDAGGDAVWSGVSAFSPKLFLPADDATSQRDLFSLPAGLAAGTYDLVVVVRDPAGFRDPLPLALNGRTADGAYLLREVTLGEAGTSTCP